MKISRSNLFITVTVVILVAFLLLPKTPTEKSSKNSETEPTTDVVNSEKILTKLKNIEDSLEKKLLLLANTSPLVKTILGLDEKSDYNTRMKAIGKLSRQLEANDIAALRDFLNQSFDPESSMTLRGFNAVKNDVLAALIDQKEPVEGLGYQLAEMFRNRELDEVWRDYSVQFMATLYETRWKPEGGGEHPEQIALRDAYREATKEVETTCAGTALLGMEMLSKGFPEFKAQDISIDSLIVATSPATCEASQITSLLMCGRLKNEKILDRARMVSQIGETVPLRLAAVNTLAEIGNEDDIYTLESMKNGKDKILNAAVERAIKKLSSQ